MKLKDLVYPFMASARLFAVVCVSLIVLCSTEAAAQQRILIEVGKSVSLPKTVNIETVFIADTSVADANVSSGNNVFVFGKSVGETTLIATSLNGGHETSYTLVVTHALSELSTTLSRRFPQETISLESSRGSILVTGVVRSEEIRALAIQTIKGIAPGTSIIDELAVSDSNTIRLQVRLLEVNRSRVRTFGIDWNATVSENGFFLGTSDRGVLQFGRTTSQLSTLNASIDVLVSNNIAAIAQATVLSTVVGEPAEFAVGGEIPVPNFISDNDGATNSNFNLDYRFIGTELTFTPRRVPGKKLQLLIESKVSSPTSSTATVNGNEFPNLSTRSFRTSVELEDRQPFVIAGLSSQNTSSNLRRPTDTAFSKAVDTIFGTDRETDNAQELVVIVTPYLGDDSPVKPVISRLPAPISNLGFLLSGGVNGTTKSPGWASPMSGPGGFKY